MGLAAMLLAGTPPLSVEPSMDVELVTAHNPEGQVMDRADHQRHRADPAQEDRRSRRRPVASAPARTARPVPPAPARQVQRTPPRRPHRAAPHRQRRTPPPGTGVRLQGHGVRVDRVEQPGPPRQLPPARKADRRSCLLAMRGCDGAPRGKGPRGKPSVPADRFASFRPRRPVPKRPAPPQVVARSGYAGMEVAQYEDGGRLVRATGKRTKRPGRGELALLTLANNTIGGRTGRAACDPYRGRAGEDGRTLVLLVDTSGSVVKAGRAPDSIVCAAGAALSALSRGHSVAVANFSSMVWYLRRTRSEDEIYTVLSRFQGEGTRLPPASLLRRDPTRKEPRDFVLVTDAAIENLKKELPGYARMIRADRRSRARLYVLGDGVACVRCADTDQDSEVCRKCTVTTVDHVRRMERAGFVADRVKRPDDDLFQSFVLNTLFNGMPGAARWVRR